MKHALIALLAIIAASPASAAECPTYPETIKTIVYQEMKTRTLVRGAYIDQKDCRLSLAIVVSHAANVTYAKDQADNMVRLTKALGPGPGPGPKKKIGRGIYDFFVGVYRPDETRVAMGMKNRRAQSIRW